MNKRSSKFLLISIISILFLYSTYKISSVKSINQLENDKFDILITKKISTRMTQYQIKKPIKYQNFNTTFYSLTQESH